MRNVTTLIASLMLVAFVLSCKNDKIPAPGKPVVLGSKAFEKEEGAGCKQPEASRTNCASIMLKWPVVEQGTPALKKSVEEWVTGYLVGILAPETDASQAHKASIGAKVQEFIKMHQAFVKEAPESPMSYFTVESSHKSLLNDGKFLTLEMEGYTYTGGAHGSPTAAVASFDIATGKKLEWDDLVTDQAAVKALAEKTFRTTRTDIFHPTDGNEPFEFDSTFQFALPANYGLNAEGIYCHYTPYEVGPYAIGSTQMTIPYSELGNLVKLKASPNAETAATETDENVSDIYEVDQSGKLVIPTFEIEVSNSAKADKTLSGKKETIIVSAHFWGEPTDPKEKDKGEDGMVVFASEDIELTGNNRIARFEGLKFDKNLLSKVEDKDISLLINVFSGRKSSDNNLLNCAILDKKASEFGGKRFVLGCKLIEEPEKGGPDLSGPSACYALPPADAKPEEGALNFLVNCDSIGNISFAEQPMKDLDALKAALRPILKEHFKANPKALPGIETEGCLMGNSGAIRDMYEELKGEFSGKTKAETPAKDKATTDKKEEVSSKEKTSTASAGKTLNNQSAKKGDTGKATTKEASKPTLPTVTLKQNGDLLLNGKVVGGFEQLRKQLQAALLAHNTIPDKIELKTVGETGMGARSEANTVINESIAGAKWVRKKAAIEALNTAVGKKLGSSTQLELGSYQTNDNFAFISAKPKLADGKAVDYSKTSYAKQAAAGKFADNVVGLLQYSKGAWKVLTFNLGETKAPMDTWVKNYKVPKALFGKTK